MEVENPSLWLMQTPWHIPARILFVNVQKVTRLLTHNTYIAVFLRSESVDSTGLHFHQAVPPVRPGHTEIVHGSPEDVDWLSLQGELGGVGTQAHLPAHPPSPCWHAGRGLLVYLCHTQIM